MIHKNGLLQMKSEVQAITLLQKKLLRHHNLREIQLPRQVQILAQKQLTNIMEILVARQKNHRNELPVIVQIV